VNARVLAIIPTYEEAENIGEVLQRVRGALPDADILVIDDGKS
jgi:dolichol-phosphate mannosyltransferase